MNNENLPNNKEPFQTTDEPIITKSLHVGLMLLGAFILVVGGWAIFAPLESAAIAPGKITVDSHRKTIKHLEGGIVSKIHVTEGMTVKKNDMLVTLDDTKSKASLDLLNSRANILFATEARLTAERDQKPRLIFPQRLINQQHIPEVKEIMEGQQRLFITSRASFNDQLDILQQRIKQSEKEIESINSQAESQDKQLKLINEEIEAVSYLEQKQLIEKPRLLALKREAARLQGNRDENLGQIAEAQQKIGETKVQIINLRNQREKEILQELKDTQRDLSEVIEQLKAAEDVLNRTVIRSPTDGRIVDLKAHTVGGVVQPGEPLMDIVPSEDMLIVEARVSPLDIDVVHPGLQARVQLTAYKQRQMPHFDGVVKTVSADSLQDQQTGQPYYQVFIQIDAKELKNSYYVPHLYPGMPAQVMIVTDKRTPWEYFLSPIVDSFHRAFREQ